MIAQAGIDTWSPCWYVDPDGPTAAAFREQAIAPAQRGKLLADPVMGHRVGWFPKHGLVYAEGHPGGARLGSPDQLAAVLQRLVGAMADRGLELDDGLSVVPWPEPGRRPGFAGVRRLDATADVAFDSGAEGQAVLRGVAALQHSGMQVLWRGRQGYIETVDMKGPGGRRTLGRWYDTGLEKGTAPRGRLIRAEDQRRYPAGARRDVSELSVAYVKSKHQQRFMPLWRASKGVTVAGPIVVLEKLDEAAAAGEITPGMVETLFGHMMISRHGPRRVQASRTTQWRRSVEVRRLGLVLSDGLMEEVEVDLHQVLEEMMESDAWGDEQVVGTG